jgi:hypothetical protein
MLAAVAWALTATLANRRRQAANDHDTPLITAPGRAPLLGETDQFLEGQRPKAENCLAAFEVANTPRRCWLTSRLSQLSG